MYSICHVDAVPEELMERWSSPRIVAEDHVIYRCEDGSSCGFVEGHAVVEDGVEVDEALLNAALVDLATAKIAAGIYEPVTLCKSHIKVVIDAVSPPTDM